MSQSPCFTLWHTVTHNYTRGWGSKSSENSLFCLFLRYILNILVRRFCDRLVSLSDLGIHRLYSLSIWHNHMLVLHSVVMPQKSRCTKAVNCEKLFCLIILLQFVGACSVLTVYNPNIPQTMWEFKWVSRIVTSLRNETDFLVDFHYVTWTECSERRANKMTCNFQYQSYF